MPKKILLADDSITIQKVVELTFSDGDYEVTAVNNGAKAVQKLSEMRPDIILSDIIMPEKNGYEVCEFVKSHPEYRNIPVVLLTGTFEPFDPDRADKAGCDAVVTKPFESQSLIHKVEELIEQARSNAPTAQTPAVTEPAPDPAMPSPWAEQPQTSTPSMPSTFSPAQSPEPAPAPFAHDADIFSAPPRNPTVEMPFGAPPPEESFSAETRGFPKIDFDMPGSAETPQTSAPPEPPAETPWDEQPSAFAPDTRAYPRMNFDEMQRPSDLISEPSAESPFGASPSAESFSGNTRAFPKIDDEVMQRLPAETTPAQEATPSPWDEQPSYSAPAGDFPPMSFDDLDTNRAKPSSAPKPAASPWDEPAPSSQPSLWSAESEPAPSIESASSDAVPFGAGSSYEPPAPAGEPDWAAPALAAISTPEPAAAQSQAASNGGELSEEQIDRIARRVVQLMSDQVVRNIAWEVIPDLAEMVVKERIRQLESEA
ncbi:MAG TPA: response regulator [Thermoanaerobaculia bacterium]